VRLYVGSDPGKAGWIAWVNDDGLIVGAEPQPLIVALRERGKGDTFDRHGMRGLVQRIRSHGGTIALWAIEQQIPVGGRARINPISAAVQFSGYGQWLGLLAGLEVPTVEVNPKRWRERLGVVKPAAKVRGAMEDPALEDHEVEEERKRHRRDVDKRRKEALQNAVRRAQALWPSVSLLASERCKVPSPDKAVAFLLAEYARREKCAGPAAAEREAV
jgi:hypothetical protein